MENQLTKRIKNLNDSLIFLVENPEFWEHKTEEQRQKSFAYTNDYYSNQIKDSFQKLIDVYKIVTNDATFNLNTIEKQYKKFNVDENKNACIEYSNILLDGIKNDIKELEINNYFIGETLNKAHFVEPKDFLNMKQELLSSINNINQIIGKSIDSILTLAVNSNEVKDESELIEMRHNSGNIEYKSGIRNFIAKFSKKNCGYKRK
jgi:hypothetical protein